MSYYVDLGYYFAYTAYGDTDRNKDLVEFLSMIRILRLFKLTQHNSGTIECYVLQLLITSFQDSKFSFTLSALVPRS